MICMLINTCLQILPTFIHSLVGYSVDRVDVSVYKEWRV